MNENDKKRSDEKESNGKYKWWFSFASKSFAFSLAFLGLLYTINSDIFIQNNVTLLPAISSLFDQKIERKNFNELLSNTNDSKVLEQKEKRVYIFALDMSKSIGLWGKPKPIWYDKAIEDLNNVLPKKDSRFEPTISSNDLTGYKISKVRLALLLLDIMVDKNADFVIWKFGNEVETLYPRSHEVNKAVSVTNIKEAICDIKNDESSPSMDTDFIKLFKMLIHNYPLKSKFYSDSKYTTYILVILSDLIHDTINNFRQSINENNLNLQEIKSQLKEKYENEKRELEKIVKELSDSDMLANVILLREAIKSKDSIKNSYKIFVWEYLFNALKENRLNYISINDKLDKFTFDNIVALQKISFYYNDPNYITDSSCVIQIDELGIYKIGLISKFKNAYYPPINFEWRVLNSDGTEKKGLNYRGNLYLDKDLIKLPQLEPREMIRLTYTGHLPDRSSLPYFRIYLPEKGRKSYLIPIKFVKRIPFLTAWIFWIAFLAPLISILIAIFLYFFPERRKNIFNILKKNTKIDKIQ